MNICIFVDKTYSAIDRMAQAVRIHNPHFNIQIFPLHPKRNDADTLFKAHDLLRWADLVDIHYWKSGEVLRASFPVDFESKPKIVCHFNPYDFDKLEWLKIYNQVVCNNKTIQNRMLYSHLIPMGIDLDFFRFNSNYTEEKVVMMSVARIESKKGVLEIAQVCKELGYKFILVGRVSDGSYVQEVLNQGAEFIENATEEILRDIYYKSAIHVCNSVDNFESGTLPILEAMACGVPVLTRNIGHVPDIYDGGNMVVRMGKKEDIKDLKKHLKDLMENRDLRLKIREKAWKTVKNRFDKRMAREFSKLYYKVLGKDHPLISIIIPTFDNHEAFIECLAAAANQDYPNLEIIVADSGNISVEKLITAYKLHGKVPLKYIRFENYGRFTLAEARNRAVVESQGEYLVFCDDRLAMAQDAVSSFLVGAKPNSWFWGVKDSYIKDFVENFSFIRRVDLIKGGMFCERIDRYGGMSQEIRERFSQLGYNFELIQGAKATSVSRSKNSEKKRQDTIESKFTLYKLYG